MANATCIVESCGKQVRASRLCGAHYEARRRERIALGDNGTTRACLGCGEIIRREKPRGPIKPYCSDNCRARCSIEGCIAPQRARGWCVFHYSRWSECGDPEAPVTRVSHSGEVCIVDGCINPQRKREWCSSHYSQWQRTGAVWPLRPWAKEFICVVCGTETGSTPGFRKFCSPPCAQLWVRHEGNVPQSVDCVRCKKSIPLAVRGKKGYRRRVDVKLCRRCRSDLRKHGMSVEQLAQRDGAVCGICGEEVDLTLRIPNRMRASVDHIMPRSRGGTNDPMNLQLAHLQCNAVKSDRVDTM